MFYMETLFIRQSYITMYPIWEVRFEVHMSNGFGVNLMNLKTVGFSSSRNHEVS